MYTYKEKKNIFVEKIAAKTLKLCFHASDETGLKQPVSHLQFIINTSTVIIITAY